MRKVVLIGECMLELREGNDGVMHQSFAGDAYNTAVYQKRAFPEQEVYFMSAIGQDVVSEKLRQHCEQASLNNQYLSQKSKQNPGVYLVQTDEYGERSFLYWRENSAARELMRYVDEDTIESLYDSDLVFFSGISLAVIHPKERPAFWAMLKRLKEQGVTLAFDPNYRPRLWRSPKEAQEQFHLAYELTDILLPGIDDFSQLYGLTELSDILEFCQPYGIHELVIKNGSNSVYCQLGSNLIHLPIAPVDHVVDTTSAGDSFNGVYIGARLAGKEIEHAVSLASKAAAIVIQYPGAITPKDDFVRLLTQ
ncbi:sugar kinase [Paraglaciecola sp. L1A13]|uniref:sugar kinase n=1 Tax=Paraglaciecola sp. L1A13 TaxID=2686359 RepID=UPI00131B7090|nr:sugar kinase [Paraglaciecola sp. L1A13]